jgi:predicted enzyme related to lactoylglutathione lyase
MINQVVWFEIPVFDLVQAMNFYSKLLKCKLSQEKYKNIIYSFFPCEESDVGGCLVKDPSI